jgi:hypothetical protein
MIALVIVFVVASILFAIRSWFESGKRRGRGASDGSSNDAGPFVDFSGDGAHHDSHRPDHGAHAGSDGGWSGGGHDHGVDAGGGFDGGGSHGH